MKNIFKYLLIALVSAFVITACDRSADRDWTTPEPSFTLYNTTLGAAVLYPTMENNPFILKWDNSKTTGGTYSVVISNREDFTTKVELGTSTSNTFTTTIGELNTAMLQAGLSPYSSQNAYIRVETGAEVSNAISFMVTPYPSAAPVITAPTAGTKIVLDGTNPDGVAAKVAWTDYNYGTDVVYTVEIAPKGSTNFAVLGTVNNLKQLSVSNLVMDQAVLKVGGLANVAADYDLRVTAATTSAGGTLKSTSAVVTVNVTPYQLESYIYAPGGYQGWNPATANTLVSSVSNNIYIGYINFPAAGTEFKFTQARNWDTNWGDDGADGTLEPGGANLKSPGAGYYKITVDLNTKTYTMVPYAIGIVGAYNGWGATPDTVMTWDDAQRKFVTTLALPAGEFKFRINGSWDENYGDSNKDGVLDNGGDNLSVAAAGTYTITYDPFAMTYSIK